MLQDVLDSTQVEVKYLVSDVKQHVNTIADSNTDLDEA